MIVGTESDITTYPYKHWLDNASYEIKSVNIYDGGTKYNERNNSSRWRRHWR